MTTLMNLRDRGSAISTSEAAQIDADLASGFIGFRCDLDRKIQKIDRFSPEGRVYLTAMEAVHGNMDLCRALFARRDPADKYNDELVAWIVATVRESGIKGLDAAAPWESANAQVVNLTPHAITIRSSDGTDTTIPPSGTVARVSTTEAIIGACPVTGVPIIRRTFGAVDGLPDDGSLCIVSAMVLSAIPGRANTYAPDTGPTAIRDDKGQIVAVTRLVAA